MAYGRRRGLEGTTLEGHKTTPPEVTQTSERHCMGTLRRVLAVTAAVAGVAGAAAPQATAYHEWSCSNYSSSQVCWAGYGYQPYRAVLNQLYVQRYAVCAKASTAAGNTRLGEGNGCGYNTSYRASCFGNTSPSSAAYVYWAGSGQPAKNMGTAAFSGEWLPNGLCG
ncbi:MAG: hypothetical protein JHC95_20850 [Solirubrobacteraceae bacterium]|nr:hypothetical protein [Solirubrobacteraceae bacterium]